MSEEIFKSRAPPSWKAVSAGVRPAEQVNPDVLWLLSEIGIKMKSRTPRLVDQSLVSTASRVVTFGCLDRCPTGARSKSEDWPLPGATGKSKEQLREIRDELARRVDALILRLDAPNPGLDRVRAAVPILRKAAERKETVTYGTLMRQLSLSRGRPLTRVIAEADRLEYERGAPGFAAIIVRKDTGYPGGGYFCDEDLPRSLQRARARSTDQRLTPAEVAHVRSRQREIWSYYSRART